MGTLILLKYLNCLKNHKNKLLNLDKWFFYKILKFISSLLKIKIENVKLYL